MSQRNRTMEDIISRAAAMQMPSDYAASLSKRKKLASLYLVVANIGIAFPRRINTQTSIPRSLVKEVRRGCPSCVHPDRMKEVAKDAILYIRTYADILADELASETTTPDDYKTSVHDMKPNV